MTFITTIIDDYTDEDNGNGDDVVIMAITVVTVMALV